MFVDDLLVITVHVTDFSPAHTDIAGRYIGIWTDMPIQLAHEGLAETHYFCI